MGGSNVKPIVTGDIKETKEFVKKYDGLGNFQIHGMDQYYFQAIRERYTTEYDNSKIRVFNIDIEVLSTQEDENGNEISGPFPESGLAEHPVVSIALRDSITGHEHIWGLQDYTNKHNYIYHQFASESALLSDFLHFWHINCPHAVTGWNIETFDIVYLVNRCKDLGLNYKLLSPFKRVQSKDNHDQFGNDFTTYRILGVQQLDYLALFKKFIPGKRPSYKLDDIAETEVNAKKLDWGDNKTFLDLYRNDYDIHMDYNMQDVNLVQMLDEKLKLLDLVFQISYYSGINYTDCMSPVRTWDAIMYRSLTDQHIVVPFSTHHSNDLQLKGAFVKAPQVGLWKWICSFDLTSLYPSIIIGWNLGSETCLSTMNDEITEDDVVYGDITYKTDNASVAVTGYQFDNRRQSYLAAQMDRLFQVRKEMKSKMIEYQNQLVEIDAEIKLRNLD